MLQKMVSLTDQNQVSIPRWMVAEWGEARPRKLRVVKVGDEIRMQPVRDFFSLAGSMKSSIKLTDEQLREARKSFENKWARGL